MDIKVCRETVLESETGTQKNWYRRVSQMAAVLLIAMLCLGGCSKKQPELSDAIKKTTEYQQKTVERPESASIGGEWTVISLLRSGEEVPSSYGEIYLSNLEKRLKEADGILSEDKYTEYARAALAVSALGKDSTDVAGCDLLMPLTDLAKVTEQGINSAVFALLALDAGKSELGDTRAEAAADGSGSMEDTADSVSENMTVREALLTWILSRELPDGGFALAQEEKEHADADITAMVLQALAPYSERAEIAQVIDRAVAVLSENQEADGTYKSWGETSCETTAQVMIALSTLGIDCESDARFVKGEKGLYNVLLNFYDGKGGFAHTTGGETDAMATDQALCAMGAYQRYKNGANALYDMTDVQK